MSGSPTFSGTGPASTGTTYGRQLCDYAGSGDTECDQLRLHPFIDGRLHITQAHLTVTADDKSRTYGAADPIFTATISGFVNGDTDRGVTGSASFSGTGPSSTGTTTVGDYVITLAAGTLNATNYDFTPFIDGTLNHHAGASDDHGRREEPGSSGATYPTFTMTFSRFD